MLYQLPCWKHNVNVQILIHKSGTVCKHHLNPHNDGLIAINTSKKNKKTTNTHILLLFNFLIFCSKNIFTTINIFSEM